jgi:hypothetical protein
VKKGAKKQKNKNKKIPGLVAQLILISRWFTKVSVCFPSHLTERKEGIRDEGKQNNTTTNQKQD